MINFTLTNCIPQFALCYILKRYCNGSGKKKNMPRLQVPIIVPRFIISYNECEFKHMIAHKMSIFRNKNSTFWKKFYTFVLYVTHLLTARFSYLYIVGDYPRNVFHYTFIQIKQRYGIKPKKSEKITIYGWFSFSFLVKLKQFLIVYKRYL